VRGSLLVASLLASLWLAGRAAAGAADEARDYLDRASGAFALNHFVEAADNYEKAFALKPDPAVLYNAAQAHRRAGNKQRALDLYQSHLRTYGSDRRAEIEKHVENLKQAIEHDRVVATAPPTTAVAVGSMIVTSPASVGGSTIVTVSEAPAPAGGQPAPVLVTQAAPAQQRAQQADDGSLVTKPWFWVVVGGAVVAAVITGVLLTRGGPSDPMATLGPPLDGN
jgi:tetratricopeptide (TPR) repeat protein